MLNNINDDRCQHPDECFKSIFTYCSHCHLFLCMTHLNEHHNLMKNDINQMSNEADNQRIVLEQQIDQIKQQQVRLNNFYEDKINYLNNMHEFVRNICDNKFDNNHSEYEKTLKQFQLVKQEQNKYSFIQQIDQILHMNSNSEPKDEISSIIDHEITVDSNEDTMVVSSNDDHDEVDSLNSKWLHHLSNSTCPLSQPNAFGFSLDHNIPGIPCNFLKSTNRLTYSRCYYHLMTYHRLKPSVAKLILKIISSNENNTLDLTKLNTFSQWSSTDILSKSKSLFVSHCPLTQENIYGIKTHHKVILCTPRSPVHLYQHLCTFHRFKSSHALRLISALINNEPVTSEIFKPEEKIINSLRSKTRAKY